MRNARRSQTLQLVDYFGTIFDVAFDVKMILIDPKIVELKLYNNIPHLLTPVITEPKKAMQALQYCLCEMERRYAVLDSLGCRDISSYNKKIVDQKICTEKVSTNGAIISVKGMEE